VAPEAHPHLYRTVRPGEDVTEKESMAYPKLREAFCLNMPAFQNYPIALHYADSEMSGKQKLVTT